MTRCGQGGWSAVLPCSLALVALVASLLLTLSAAAPALGAGEATIRIESAHLTRGQTSTLALEGLGFPAPGLGAITVDVVYDPTAVAVTACKGDPKDVFDAAVCNQEFADGTVRVTAIDIEGEAGDFSLADLTFAAVGESGRQKLDVVVVTLTDPAGADIDALTEDGVLTIDAVSESTEPPAPPSDGSQSGTLQREDGTPSTSSLGESEPPPSTSEDATSETSASEDGALSTDAVSESEPPSAPSEGGESATSQPADPQLPDGGGGHPLLQSDQPWLYMVVAALVLGVAAVGFAFIRKRRKA